MLAYENLVRCWALTPRMISASKILSFLLYLSSAAASLSGGGGSSIGSDSFLVTRWALNSIAYVLYSLSRLGTRRNEGPVLHVGNQPIHLEKGRNLKEASDT